VAIRLPSLEEALRKQPKRKISQRFFTPARRAEFAAAHAPRPSRPSGELLIETPVVLRLSGPEPRSRHLELADADDVYFEPTQPRITRRSPQPGRNAAAVLLLLAAGILAGWYVAL
jgi:hypothetical protein